MTDTATPFPALDAAPALEPGAPEDVRPLIDHNLEILGELAELGLKAARAVIRQAESETPPPPSETALAYARVSRAIRLTLMLQGKLIEARDEEAELQEMFTPVYRRKARVEKIVERIVEAEIDDEEAADAIIVEAGERLDDEDLYGDLMDRPVSEIVERLCKDLHLTPDWSELSQELWAKREGVTSPNAVALAGGVSSVAANDLAAMRTPAACYGPEPAAEPVVEGEGQAHGPFSLDFTDSS